MSTLLEQASLVMIPSGYKEDIVYSQIPTNGSGDLSFTRASNGTRVNSAGLVEVCPWNLLTYSEDLSNGAWTAQGSSVTTDSTTAPNGTTTADTLIESNTTDEHNRFQIINISGQYTFSVYLKKYNVDWCALYVFNPSVGGIRYWINVNTLTAGTSANIGSGIGTTSLSLESVGNGWVRASILFNNPSGDCRFYVANAQSNGGATTYAGNGTNGVYVWGAQVNLGTLKPYFPTTDRLNVPRLTYQNGGGGCPSLLLEKQSTNLITYSEQFDNAVHYKLDVTITANNITSPDGTQNADKFTETTGTGEHIVYDIDSNATGTYTLSAFFKGGAGTIYPVLRLNGSSTTAYAGCIFDTSTGAVVNTFYNTYSAPTTKVENMGNGWYRVSMTTTTTDANFGMRIAASNSTSPSVGAYGAISYTGSTSNYFYVYGAQLEASSYPTSYIPTTSSSATRVADACYKTGISSLIGQTEGVMFLDFVFTNINDVQVIMSLHDNSNNKRIEIWANSANIYGFVGGTSAFNMGPLTGTTGTRYKMAVAYKSGNSAFYVNGTQIQLEGTTFTISLTSLIFSYWGGFYEPNAKINQAVLFPTRLTNAELASLTTI